MADDHLTAGALRDRLHFQCREITDDGFGNIVASGDFVTQFTVSAALRPLRGTETVMAARLKGMQPYIATIRQSIQTRLVTTSWRIVDARNQSRVFAISAPPTDPRNDRAWFEILVTEGVES